MTSSKFDDRYQLLKCVAVADGLRTHNALETTTGRVVMVHLLDAAGPDAVDALRSQLGRLPHADKSRILETATLPSGFAVVTEFLQGLATFSDWLAARVPAELPSEAAGESTSTKDDVPPTNAGEAMPEPAATQPPGDFTRLFGAQSIVPPATEEPASPPPARKAPIAESPVAGPSQAAAGAPAAAVPPPPPPAASPLMPAIQSSSSVTGEKPRVGRPRVILRSDTPPPKSKAPSAAAQPPAEPPLAPGEFTHFFQPPIPTPPSEAAPSPFADPSPLAGESSRSGWAGGLERGSGGRDPRAPGESPLGGSSVSPSSPSYPPSSASTRVPVPPLPPHLPPVQAMPPLSGSGGAAAPSAAVSPPGASPIGGSSSSLGSSPFGTSSLGASQSPPLPPVLPPPVFAPPRSGGSFSPLGAAPAARSAEETPSDYTQMIQQSVTPAPALPKAPKQTAEPDKPRKRSIPLGLIIALNVVLVLSIVLVVYFIFRPSPPTAAPQGGVPLPATPATPAAPQVPPAKLPAVTAPKTPVP